MAQEIIIVPTIPVSKSVNKGLSEVLNLRVIIKYKPYITPVPKAAKLAKFNSTKPGLMTTNEPIKPTITAVHLLKPTFSPNNTGDKAVTIKGAIKAKVSALAKEISGRRSGLTALADKGVSVRVLMAIAGHSQIATTQRYIDLRPSVVRAAVELV